MKIEALAGALAQLKTDLLTSGELLTKAGFIVEAGAKKRAPVKTGTLRNDINSRVDGNVAYVGNSVSYAPFVHEGTSRMPGRPYIQWGIEDSISEIEHMMGDVANVALGKVGG